MLFSETCREYTFLPMGALLSILPRNQVTVHQNGGHSPNDVIIEMGVSLKRKVTKVM